MTYLEYMAIIHPGCNLESVYTHSCPHTVITGIDEECFIQVCKTGKSSCIISRDCLDCWNQKMPEKSSGTNYLAAKRKAINETRDDGCNRYVAVDRVHDFVVGKIDEIDNLPNSAVTLGRTEIDYDKRYMKVYFKEWQVPEYV